MTRGDELLVVEDLKKHFPITRGIIFQKNVGSVKAVDGVNFTIKQGETLGIVGESGCGKSTLARCIVRLLDTTDGRLTFEGRDITKLSRAAMRPIRREMTMIFQDPYASLNPRTRAGFILGAPPAPRPRPRRRRRGAGGGRGGGSGARGRGRAHPEGVRRGGAGLGARRLG